MKINIGSLRLNEHTLVIENVELDSSSTEIQAVIKLLSDLVDTTSYTTTSKLTFDYMWSEITAAFKSLSNTAGCNRKTTDKGLKLTITSDDDEYTFEQLETQTHMTDVGDPYITLTYTNLGVCHKYYDFFLFIRFNEEKEFISYRIGCNQIDYGQINNQELRGIIKHIVDMLSTTDKT
jgi:hypothetical protein